MSVVGAQGGPDAGRRTHFLDAGVNEQMALSGYAVLDERLSVGQVDQLAALYRGVIDVVGTDDSGTFRPSMMIAERELRSRLWDGVGELLAPVLMPMLDPAGTEVIGGSFVSKPASETSARDPHQDPSIFDERVHVSLSVWIPLSDTHIGNGTLWMLPGSHLLGNAIRPPDVDSLDAEFRDLALRDSVPIELDAGQMLVIDGSVVHHSPPNESGHERIAAICALRPTGSTMWYVRSDAGAATGVAEVRDVGVELYRSGDLIHPDLDSAPLVERRRYRPATVEDFRANRPIHEPR